LLKKELKNVNKINRRYIKSFKNNTIFYFNNIHELNDHRFNLLLKLNEHKNNVLILKYCIKKIRKKMHLMYNNFVYLYILCKK